MSNFNTNLKQLREKKGLSAKEIAIDLGIPYTTYIKYEWNGEPRYDTLIRIADYLEASIDELLGYTPNAYENAKARLEQFHFKVDCLDSGKVTITAPQIKEKTLLHQWSFDSKADFVKFVDNCSSKILSTHFEEYVINTMYKYGMAYLDLLHEKTNNFTEGLSKKELSEIHAEAMIKQNKSPLQE